MSSGRRQTSHRKYFLPRMKFLTFFFLACVRCGASPFNVEEFAAYLPLLRKFQFHACPPNEIWQMCSGNCSDCERRGSCIDTDCQSGCDCVSRYFRLDPNGPCLPVSRCPRPKCGGNEVFRKCGPVCEKCGALPCRIISCDHRCYCRQGHLRNQEGACVPVTDCPRTKCSHNEAWAESGPIDEYWPHEEEVSSNRTREVPGCYCIEGHKRNSYGSCVSSCSVRCYGLAVYRACVPKCNVTCESDATCEEDDDCFPGCFCPPGHVMNEFNTCINQTKCSADMPEVKIVHGSGIMVEGPQTTLAAESTTPGYSEPPDKDSKQTVNSQTELAVDGQTEASTEQEDLANEDI